MNGPILIAAPAKINLYLHITGKREDGYHLLDSLVVFAYDIADTVRIEDGPDFSMSVSGPFADVLLANMEDPSHNLVVKAARMMAQAAGRPLTSHIHLEKNIPLGAGLGGGSSDAAAVVRGLERMWGVRLPPPDLARLGADVPVCYAAKPCRFSGIGDILAPVPPLPSLFMMLIWPGVHSSTKDVFRTRREASYTNPPVMPGFYKDHGDLVTFLKGTKNDLGLAARDLVPKIGDALDTLNADRSCLLSRMSGSGASVFGLYENENTLQASADIVRAAHPSWWVKAIKIAPSKS